MAYRLNDDGEMLMAKLWTRYYNEQSQHARSSVFVPWQFRFSLWRLQALLYAEVSPTGL